MTTYDTAKTALTNWMYSGGKGRITPESVNDRVVALTDSIFEQIVNDLTTGGVGSFLSAEQGKALKTLIDARITTASIVNDLTTGGTSVPLSAEQGKALKAMIDALANVLIFKGSWDASAGTFPGGGTAKTGWFYKVTVGGTVNGVPFTAGDNIYAVTDNASTTTYAANWIKVEGSISSAEVIAALGYTPLNPANAGTDFQAPVTAGRLAAFAFGPFTSIASAATCDLSTVATVGVNVTGTTTITSFGTGANLLRMVKFAGAVLLTHTATTLMLPTAANITTAAGDSAIFLSDGSGNWTCVTYQRADGTALVAASASIASQAEAESGTDTTKQMTAVRTSQAIANRPTSFKNIAGRNGGMEVWQRGTSVSVAASTTAYTLDGWYLKTGTNQAATVAQATGLVAQSQFAAKVQRNSGQTGTGAMYFAMPLDIDELVMLRSGAAVLSFQVSTGANWSPTSGTLTYNVYCGTGAVGKRNSSAYTSESNPITGTVNLSTGASAQQVISAISSAIGSGITQAEIQFSWTPTGTAGANDWFAIDDVQLEIVPTGLAAVTPKFERLPMNAMVAMCQRHYQSSSQILYGSQVNSSGNTSYACWKFTPAMRASPTIGGSNSGTVQNTCPDFTLIYQVSIGTYPYFSNDATASAEI